MARQIYLDGTIVPEHEAHISVFDHGLLYGDGVFEGIRAYGGRVFRLREHLVRLYAGAKSIMLDIGMPMEQMARAVVDTLRANDRRDGYVRLVVTRGVGDLGLDPRKCKGPTVFIIADDIALYPREVYEEGMSVITVTTCRVNAAALDPAIKSLNYLNNILARTEVNRAGAHEGILLNSQGFVTEATGDNVFIVKNGRLLTPPEHSGLLVGVTRNAVMELARRAGIEVVEPAVTKHMLYTADECFLTGTAAEVVAVRDIDGRRISEEIPGPMTRMLRAAFHELTMVEGELIFPEEAEGAAVAAVCPGARAGVGAA